VQKHVSARPLEARDGLETESVELGLANLSAGLRDDERHDLLAPVAVRAAHDGDLSYGRVRQQYLLDLARVDIAATGDYQVFGAVFQRKKTVGIEAADVARVQPAAAQRIAARGLVAPIAGHDDVAATDNLASLADGQVAILTVDHADFHVGARQARRAQPLEPARMGKLRLH